MVSAVLVTMRHGKADRLADHPDDAGENEREAEAEERSGKRDDDLLPGRRGRQFLAGRLGLALDGFHRCHLRQGDVTARWDRAEDVIDAVDFFGPKRLAKPDREFVDLKPAPLRGQEMAQLVDNDQDVKEKDDFEESDEGEKDRSGPIPVSQRNEDGQSDGQNHPQGDTVKEAFRWDGNGFIGRRKRAAIHGQSIEYTASCPSAVVKRLKGGFD
jgi:hypothetical protein